MDQRIRVGCVSVRGRADIPHNNECKKRFNAEDGPGRFSAEKTFGRFNCQQHPSTEERPRDVMKRKVLKPRGVGVQECATGGPLDQNVEARHLGRFLKIFGDPDWEVCHDVEIGLRWGVCVTLPWIPSVTSVFSEKTKWNVCGPQEADKHAVFEIERKTLDAKGRS